MRCLLRRITRKARAGVSHTEHTVDKHALDIGRGADQDIFLADLHVALHHAVLRPASDERFALQARTPSGVQINGRTNQAGVVEFGDVVTIGRSTIRVKRPPRGYDVALEIEEAQAERGEPTAVGATSLQAAGLRRRPWAWFLFLVVIGLGLVVPFTQIYDREPTQVGMQQFESQSRSGFDWRLAGGDHLWDSGPMSRSHRFFGQQCQACHREAFQRVTNAACADCHADQPHHSDDAELLRVSGLSEQRCADCHVEHNGSEALIMTDQKLCTGCHTEPRERMPGTDIRSVSGFGPERHPEFRIRLVARTPDGEAPFTWSRLRMDQPLQEQNGLVFPHDVHLDESGLESPEGKQVLACADCHEPDQSGADMDPITFEQDCQSCHQLNFEPRDAKRELPHGDPDEILDTLDQYYARIALGGGYSGDDADRAPEVVRQRRPAQRELDREERRAALDWANAKAAEVATEVIEYRTCTTCHDVERTEGADDGPQWDIEPVALTAEWYPRARFSHDPHTAMECSECHAASDSETSSDVLMPSSATCQQCHGDEDSHARITSRCVDCHGFHTRDELTMTGNTH